MADVAVEQWRPEVEDVAEAGLKAVDNADLFIDKITAITRKEVIIGHDLNKNEDTDTDTGVLEILKFDEIGAQVKGSTNGGYETREKQSGESSGTDAKVVEEEIVELEFEKVKPKLDTHSMHCPNCKAEVTKVILRRKVLSYRPVVDQPVVVEPTSDPKDLVGCFSCLSLFTFSENGSFNPFDIFRKRPDTTNVTSSTPTGDENGKLVVREKDNCLSMFWVFGKEQNSSKPVDPVYVDREYSDPVDQTPKFVTGSTSIAKGRLPSSSSDAADLGKEIAAVVNNGGAKKGGLLGLTFTSQLPSSELAPSSSAGGDDDIAIQIGTEPEVADTGRLWLGYNGVFAEILKSIVYGGLMEVIASLSVVASAAAADATTLNIISVALASLVGGVFIIANNLWDLRDDGCKERTIEETENKTTNKYKELLGQVDYFPLHAFFAILSFLVFGMVPPVAYGYSIHETNDKDYTIVAVAVASLLCVSLLAILKAYINRCTFFGYFKTVVYYVTAAVSASGVSYVAGNLVTRLMEEYGLFDASSSGGVSLIPYATTASLASF